MTTHEYQCFYFILFFVILSFLKCFVASKEKNLNGTERSLEFLLFTNMNFSPIQFFFSLKMLLTNKLGSCVFLDINCNILMELGSFCIHHEIICLCGNFLFKRPCATFLYEIYLPFIRIKRKILYWWKMSFIIFIFYHLKSLKKISGWKNKQQKI